MDADLLRFIAAGFFFLFIFISGFRMARKGKPYGAILYNFHKLIALAAFVLFAITVYQMNQTSAPGTLEIMAAAASAIFFIATIATGGLASIDRPISTAGQALHKLLPYLTVLSSAGTLYLLIRRAP